MDGASAAATILQLVETGISVSRAVYQYGVSVKNAKKSCQRLIEEIQLINTLAIAAEESVGKLSTSAAPASFCRCWIDSQSPAMRYKSELDKFKKKVEQGQDVCWAKSFVWQLRWPSKESEIEAAIESFEGYIKHLNLAVALTSSDALIAISKQGEEHGTLLKGAINSDELQKMYDWMDAVNCTTKYEITLGQRQDETCKWLLDLKRYSDWRSSRNAFLRVCGKPGAGKSVLISAVIDSLSKTEIKGGALAYFYCDFRTDRTTHACEVIRSLVTQLLVKSNKDWLPLFPDLVNASRIVNHLLSTSRYSIHFFWRPSDCTTDRSSSSMRSTSATTTSNLTDTLGTPSHDAASCRVFCHQSASSGRTKGLQRPSYP
ncbi:hypothetical protein BU15DRAFT_80246 [Melanogaster broomeanus]|nr:hypothetical protein BU15DRAFT_80246 [Melanogaster broomeanus]